MSDILKKICDDKLDYITLKKSSMPLKKIKEVCHQASPIKGFYRSLKQAKENGKYGFICEIKKASPSKGLIRPDFDPPELARAYKTGGATCISVLTDEKYFQGHDEYLKSVRAAVDLPLLRKDFMLDPYQVFEARMLGADCILLIMAALSDGQALELEETALGLGLDSLIEVHSAEEIDRALKLKSKLIGINNRNLKTMSVSIETTAQLVNNIPGDYLVVAESGLKTAENLAYCAKHGVTSFLMGETFMRADDVANAVKALSR